MILAKHGLLAGARLRQNVDEVRRVIVARTDGIALYDDVPLEKRDGAAALWLVGGIATLRPRWAPPLRRASSGCRGCTAPARGAG